jgi:hypothetical protein
MPDDKKAEAARCVAVGSVRTIKERCAASLTIAARPNGSGQPVWLEKRGKVRKMPRQGDV